MSDNLEIQTFKCANCGKEITGISTDQLMDRGWIVLKLLASYGVRYSCVCPDHIEKYANQKAEDMTISAMFKAHEDWLTNREVPVDPIFLGQ